MFCRFCHSPPRPTSFYHRLTRPPLTHTHTHTHTHSPRTCPPTWQVGPAPSLTDPIRPFPGRKNQSALESSSCEMELSQILEPCKTLHLQKRIRVLGSTQGRERPPPQNGQAERSENRNLFSPTLQIFQSSFSHIMTVTDVVEHQVVLQCSHFADHSTCGVRYRVYVVSFGRSVFSENNFLSGKFDR